MISLKMVEAFISQPYRPAPDVLNLNHADSSQRIGQILSTGGFGLTAFSRA
jgi:hypothetical protein